MPDFPYTDTDLRAEAARQLRDVQDPENLDVTIEGHKIPSRGDFQWDQLDGDDFHEADREISALVEGAPDLSRWAVDLGASFLNRTAGLVWGYGDNWLLAVQVAHRRGIAEDLHAALVDAVRGAVNDVIADRGLDAPELPQTDAEEVSR